MANIHEKLLNGVMVTVMFQAATVIVQFVALLILAKFLDKQDFGIIAMAVPCMMFLSIFNEAGFLHATVQAVEVADDQLNHIFWLNIIIGVVLASALVSVSPLVVWFYGESTLYQILPCYALAFAMNSVSIQFKAVMSREMNFWHQGLGEFIPHFTGAVVAIIFALCGGGYWALVLLTVVRFGGRAISFWMLSEWRPSAPAFKYPNVKEIVRFGGCLTGSSLVGFVAQNADKVLLGRFCGLEAVGLYYMAQRVVLFPVQELIVPYGRVVVAGLSRVQGDACEYAKLVKRFLFGLVVIGVPILTYLCFDSEWLVVLSFGAEWKELVPYVEIFACIALIMLAREPFRWVSMSRGLGARIFKATLIVSLVRLLLTVLLLPSGPLAVAGAFLLTTLLCYVPVLVYIFRGTPISLVDVLSQVGALLVPSILSFLCVSHWGVTGALGLVLYFVCFGAVFLLIPSNFRRTWVFLQTCALRFYR